MKRAKVLIGAVLAVVLVVGLYFVNRYWISPALRTQTISNGDHPAAPDFSLRDISGKTIKLSEYRGKVVILDFWATWCGPCRIEIPEFVEMQNRYGNQGLAVIGVSMDDGLDPVISFYKEFRMNYPVVMGNDRLGEMYGGILGLPTTFLIGRDGRIYAKHVGATSISVFEEEVKQLLGQSSSSQQALKFKQEGPGSSLDQIELGNPAEVDSAVPGVDLSKLTKEQQAAFEKLLDSEHCTCGCNFSVLKCREVDRSCGVSLKLARQELKKFLARQTT